MEISEKRHFILNENMKRVIITLALPVMLNNFIQTIYNLTDTFFVSKLGTTQIAAIQFVWPIIFFMMSVGAGVAIAATSLISQYIGADEKEMAKRVAGQILLFSSVFSVSLGIAGYIFTPAILKIMGAKGSLYSEALIFLRIMLAGGPTMFLMFAFNAIRNGLGDTYSPMRLGAMSVLTNIILDPIFIFSFKWGIAGAAYATVLARGFFGVYAVFTLFSKHQELKLTRQHIKFDKEIMGQLLHLGVPSSLGQSTEALGFMVLNVFIISFGEATLTAFAIGNQINSLILMPSIGIASAITTVVGQNMGADNIPRAKLAVKTSIKLAVIFLSVAAIPLLIFAEKIIRIFSSDISVITQGTAYLTLITLSIPLVAIFQSFVGTFQGSGHTRIAMIMLMARLWILRLPVIILLKMYTNFGSSLIWYSMIGSNFVICIVGYLIYKTGIWEKRVINNKAPVFMEGI